MRRVLALVAMIVALSAPAAADGEERSPQELAREGLAKLLDAMELLIDEIPQYAAPEVLPNGDIIIRRLDEPAPDDDREEGGQDEGGKEDRPERERDAEPSESPTET